MIQTTSDHSRLERARQKRERKAAAWRRWLEQRPDNHKTRLPRTPYVEDAFKGNSWQKWKRQPGLPPK